MTAKTSKIRPLPPALAKKRRDVHAAYRKCQDAFWQDASVADKQDRAKSEAAAFIKKNKVTHVEAMLVADMLERELRHGKEVTLVGALRRIRKAIKNA